MAVTVLALLLRWPYWRTIPAAYDETGQAIFALEMLSGHSLPLTGTDAYTGPFFVYLLAGLFSLGVSDPLIGRAVMLAAGTLIAPLTYTWVRDWGGRRLPGLLAAALVAANPHLIVLNSHAGGATFLIPFFTTLYFWLMTRAVVRDQARWWLVAAVAAGLAVQSNPLSALPVLAGWLWFAMQTRRSARLGWRWPLWPALGALAIFLVESPIVWYNVMTAGRTVTVLEQRSYLWESDPTLYTYMNNLRRIALQLARQLGGVFRGSETLTEVLGLPLLLAAWAAGAPFSAPRPVRSQLAAAVLPYILIVPYFSGHFGAVEPVRFTTYMTPAFAVSMAWLVERAAQWLPVRAAAARAWTAAAIWLAAFLLVLQPLRPLAGYYQYIQRNHLGGDILLTLSEEMTSANRGESVYLGFPDAMLPIGIPYVPQAHLILAGIQQAFMPPDEIIGRLFAAPGPAMLLLSDSAAAQIGQVAALVPWPGPANGLARQQGYGLYTLKAGQPLIKPEFVLTGAKAESAAPQMPLKIVVGDGLELLGYDFTNRLTPGGLLEVKLYWKLQHAMPAGSYMGFVHLLDSSGQTLVAQSDHLLGRTRYPVNAWQADEVIIEDFRLSLPAEVAAGSYVLRTGVYLWPSLERLAVPGGKDNLIELSPVFVGP